MAEKTLGQVAYEARLGNRKTWKIEAQWLRDDYETAADAVAQAHEARRWKSIESAPKDGKTIFGWTGRECRHIAYLSEKHGRDEGWYMHAYNEWCPMSNPPKYWTPIPAPPKEAGDE